MKAKKFVVFAMLVAALILTVTGCGFRSYTVSGRVLDPSGDALAGAKVSSSGKTSATTTTDENGDWQLVGLKGTNTIKVTVTDMVFEPGTKEISEESDNLNFQGLFPIIIDKVGKGLITPYPNKPGYQMGEKVTLTATPDVGWNFSKWSGSYNTADEAITIFMEGPKKISGIFEQIAGSIIFADPKLEAAVRRAINKPLGIITKTDVEELNFLNASVNYIQSLQGIENLASLTWLDLSVTGTTQITQLANLLSLEYLNLASNQIVDTSAVKSLARLGELYLNNNKIIDISSLAWLTGKSLKKLDLSNNQIQKVGALTNITTLEILVLSNNQIVDISPLVGLTKLKELELSNNSVDKISALNYMKSLEKLNLRKNKLTSIDTISWLKDGSLREVNLSENQITDISKLGGLTTIEKLNLSANQIANITEISKLVNLREVNLSNNQITDLSPLATLPLVEKVYLHKNKISDIGPLLQMTSLKEVTLMDNDLNLSTGLEDWEVVETLRARGVLVRYDYYQNDAPIIQYPDFETKTIKENEPQTFKVEASDPNRDEMVFSAEGELAYCFDPATQIFSWVPSFDDSALNDGLHSVTFVVQDSETMTKKTVTYTVENVNRAPEITLNGFKEDIKETDRLTFTVSAIDPDGENVTYSAEGQLIEHFNLDTLTFDWQTDYTHEGEYQITFSATDDNPDDPKTESLIVTIRVAKTNQIPEWVIIGNKTIKEGQNIRFAVNATEKDPEDTLVYSVKPEKYVPFLDLENAEFNWTPTYSDAGIHNLIFEVSDGMDTVQQTVTIIVEDQDRAPEWKENTTYYFVDEYSQITFSVAAEDPDGDIITYGVTNLPTGATINAQTGEFRWTPTYEHTQVDGGVKIGFTATAKGLSTTEPLYVTVMVVDVPFPPMIGNVGPKTVTEGEPLTIQFVVEERDRQEVSTTIDFEFNYNFDPTTNTFTWTPGYDICTKVSPTYVTNLTFTVVDTDNEKAEIVVPITIKNGNRPPIISLSYHEGTVQEETDSSVTIVVNETETIWFDVSLIDQDGDAINLTVGGPQATRYKVSEKKFFWLTTYADASDSHYVKFTADDGMSTTEKIVYLKVINVDRPPMTYDILNPFTGSVEPIVVNEYTPISFYVRATDPDGDKITYTADPLSPLPAGAVLDANSGLFQWTPDYRYAPWSGILRFLATANGVSASANIQVTVNDIQFDPEFTSPINSTFTVMEGDPVEYQVVAMDKDNDALTYSISFPTVPGDPGTPLYPAIVTDMLTAAFDPATGWFRWTPGYETATSESLVKEYQMFYTVEDSTGRTKTKSVTVTVNNKDRHPIISVPQADVNFVVTMVRDLGVAQTFNLIVDDQDGEMITITAPQNLPPGAIFEPPLNQAGHAVGLFNWSPGLGDVGVYELNFVIQSGTYVTTKKVTVRVQGTRLSVDPITFDKSILRPSSDPAIDVVLTASSYVTNSGNVKTGAVPIEWRLTSVQGANTVHYATWPGTELSPIDPGLSRLITFELSANTLKSLNVPFGTVCTLQAVADVDALTGGPADNVGTFEFKSPLFTLTVGSDPVMGTYIVDPVKEKYELNESITVTAKPRDGYMFKNWTDNNNQVVSSSQSYQFNILGNTVLMANFEQITLPRKLVFVSKRNKPNGELLVMEMNGTISSITGSYDLRDIGAPKWAPLLAGEKILFDATDASGRRDVWLYDFSTQFLSNLTQGSSGNTNKAPSWSPDGNQFVYLSNSANTSFDIVVRNIDGTSVQRITTTEFEEKMVSWDPVNPNRFLGVTVLDGKSMITLWTVNGALLSVLYLNEQSPIAPEGINPIWSPDGKKIAFEYQNNIYMAEYSNNWNIKQVTNTGTVDGVKVNRNPSWSASLSPLQLVYESNKLGTFDIYTIETTGTFENQEANAIAVTTIATDESDPRWSYLDGKIVYVAADADGDKELFMVNDTGGMSIQITSNLADDYYPRWKP